MTTGPTGPIWTRAYFAETGLAIWGGATPSASDDAAIKAIVATAVTPEVHSHIKLPWDVVAIEIPNDLLAGRTADGEAYRVTTLFVSKLQQPTPEAELVYFALTDTHVILAGGVTRRGLAGDVLGLDALDGQPFVMSLSTQERRVTHLLQRLIANVCLAMSDPANLKPLGKVGTIDFHLLDRALADALGDLEATLRDDVVRARAALSKLLVGRVLFQPTTTEVGGKPRRTYRLEASLAIGRLLVSPDDQRVQAVHVPDGTWTLCTSPIRQVDVVVPAVKAA